LKECRKEFISVLPYGIHLCSEEIVTQRNVWLSTLLFALLFAALPAAQGADKPKDRLARATGREVFQATARHLDLTREQTKSLLLCVRAHVRNMDAPAFKEAVLAILTTEQKEKLSRILGAEPALDAAEALEIRVQRDLSYAEPGGEGHKLKRLDIYAPAGAKDLPVIIFVHGGGWRKGDKKSADSKGRFFAKKGFLFVSINYRLSPAVRHPVHVQDVAQACAWVRKNAKKHGGDASRVYVMGHSAGAHLAALVAVDKRRLAAHGVVLPFFKGVILLDGAGYDISRQMTEFGGYRSRLLYGVPFGSEEQTWKDASPTLHAKSGKGFAPFLILHVARREASRLQSSGLADALRTAGGKATVVPAQDKTHGSINRDIGKPNDAVTEKILRFLDCPQ
jgi:acetyl esterase/lipase